MIMKWRHVLSICSKTELIWVNEHAALRSKCPYCILAINNAYKASRMENK